MVRSDELTNFVSEPPRTLEQLQMKIAKGNVFTIVFYFARESTATNQLTSQPKATARTNSILQSKTLYPGRLGIGSKISTKGILPSTGFWLNKKLLARKLPTIQN